MRLNKIGNAFRGGSNLRLGSVFLCWVITLTANTHSHRARLARGELIPRMPMKTNPECPLSRWSCVRLHLNSRIKPRHALRLVAFHLLRIACEFTPNRGLQG